MEDPIPDLRSAAATADEAARNVCVLAASVLAEHARGLCPAVAYVRLEPTRGGRFELGDVLGADRARLDVDVTGHSPGVDVALELLVDDSPWLEDLTAPDTSGFAVLLDLAAVDAAQPRG